jgi:integrase
MSKIKLTELAVARMKPPKTGRVDVWDVTLPAFGLRVSATGRKTWIAAIRKPGSTHPTRLTVGRWPDLALADARTRAREMMADPSGVAEEQRRSKTTTVGEAIEQFIERYQRPRNRAWREVQRTLERELANWRHRPIVEITRRDVIEALDRTADRAPYLANRLLAHLRKLCNWCLERGILEASPVANVKAPTREVSRDRVLNDDELARVWQATEVLGWPFGPLVRLLITTAARRDEVAHMAWPDLDLDLNLWILPRELTKADRVHEVPLNALSLEVIEALPRIGDGLVFPAGRTGNGNPVSGFSKAKSRLDQLSGVTDWRLHDLRRSAASGMAKLGHPPHVVAAILNHSPGSTQGITAVYNRHRYGEEKRLALEAWGHEVERILGRDTGQVVALSRRA